MWRRCFLISSLLQAATSSTVDLKLCKWGQFFFINNHVIRKKLLITKQFVAVTEICCLLRLLKGNSIEMAFLWHYLQLPISIVGWLIAKCTSFINKQCCSHYGRCKGGTYFTISPIFTTVETKLQMWSFLLLTTSFLQVLAWWTFQIRLNMIGYHLQKWIQNTSGCSCLLRNNEKSINNMHQTSPSSWTNFSFEPFNSPGKTQPASDDKLI